MKKGKFIVIEGGDFCGKTTFVEQLQRVLSYHGFESTMIRSPGGDVEGEKIRELLVNTKLDEGTRTCIFAGNRVHVSTQVIKPLTKQGKHVISTRWRWSADVYQDVSKVSNFIDDTLGVCKPDLYILLECSDEVMKDAYTKRQSGELVNGDKLNLLDEEYTKDYNTVRERYRIAFEAHRDLKMKLVYNEGGTVPSDELFIEKYKSLIDLIVNKL